MNEYQVVPFSCLRFPVVPQRQISVISSGCTDLQDSASASPTASPLPPFLSLTVEAQARRKPWHLLFPQHGDAPPYFFTRLFLLNQLVAQMPPSQRDLPGLPVQTLSNAPSWFIFFLALPENIVPYFLQSVLPKPPLYLWKVIFKRGSPAYHVLHALPVLEQGLAYPGSSVIIVEQMNHDLCIFRFFLHFK